MDLLLIYKHTVEPNLAIAPLVLAAIISAAHQARVAYQQSRKAKKLEEGLTRPAYKTPEEIRMNLINAQKKRLRASLFGLPGQGLIQNRIEGNAAAGNANAIQVGQDPASIMATINANTVAANNATADLGVKAAEFQQNNIDTADAGVSNALQLVAAGKDKEFGYNQDEPYKARVAAISALKEASGKNLDNAFGSSMFALGGGEGNNNRTMPPQSQTQPSALKTTATVPDAMTTGNNTGPIVAPNPTVSAGYSTQRPLPASGGENSNEAMIDALQRQHPNYTREQIRSMYGGLF